MTYCINTPAVIADILDGEAIIINLKSGRYYSMEGCGAWVWSALIAGHDPAVIAARLASADAAAVRRDLDAFVAQLSAEELIREAGSDPAAAPLPDYAGSYAAPTLNVFTDMESMLLLDPIHKVDDAGWPHPAAE